jgi:hypothetical protein
MPKKIQNTTKAHIISVPLPQHGDSYTVISHQFIIDYAYQALANAGFGIVDEEYRCTADGQIAQGIYKLQFNSDPELSMMFAWTNSYNKQVKFKCVVGAYINNTGSVMISGDMGSWVRKHMGAADVETQSTIDEYVTNAHMYYNQLVSDKVIMEGITLNKRRQAQLLGVLFAEYEILTTEQASTIRDQMRKPSFAFSNTESLWAFYNYVTIALQQSHPRTWMEDQRILHHFISSINNFQQVNAPVTAINAPVEITQPMTDPLDSNYGQPANQTNLLVQIAEVTGDDSVLLTAQDQVNEIHEFSMAQLAGVKAPEDIVIHVETDEEYNARVAAIEGELKPKFNWPDPSSDTLSDTVQYTDPQGNTFEAPIVTENFVEELEKKMVENAEETNQVIEELIWGTTPDVPSLEPTPEDYMVYESEQEENPFAEEDNFEAKEDMSIFELDEPKEFTLLTEEEREESFNWDLDESEDDSEGPDFF